MSPATALMNEWAATFSENRKLLVALDGASGPEESSINERWADTMSRLYEVEDRIEETPGGGGAFIILKLKIFLERARVSEIDDDPIFGMVRSALRDLEAATARATGMVSNAAAEPASIAAVAA